MAVIGAVPQADVSNAQFGVAPLAPHEIENEQEAQHIWMRKLPGAVGRRSVHVVALLFSPFRQGPVAPRVSFGGHGFPVAIALDQYRVNRFAPLSVRSPTLIELAVHVVRSTDHAHVRLPRLQVDADRTSILASRTAQACNFLISRRAGASARLRADVVAHLAAHVIEEVLGGSSG